MVLTEYKEKCVGLLSRCVCFTECESRTSPVDYGFVNKTPISQSMFSWMIINIKRKKDLCGPTDLGPPERTRSLVVGRADTTAGLPRAFSVLMCMETM